jgi:hypothetical protein
MYQQIINNNSHRFQTGSVIKRRTFCKLFRAKKIVHEGGFAEVQRSNLTLVGIQAEVNRILRHSGLVMKSRDYYSEFYICSLKQTADKVLAYQEKSEVHRHCSNVLEKATIQRLKAGTWGVYNKHAITPLQAVSEPPHSATYKNKQKRVKRWKE